jgi:SAM-dependent methyltransferase
MCPGVDAGMKQLLADLLVDPIDRKPLAIEVSKRFGDECVSGRLISSRGDAYELRDGIPRLVITSDAGQTQTADTFAFKWRKRDTYDSPSFRAVSTAWCVEKYGFGSLQQWAESFAASGRVLDIGCGSGFSSSLWLTSPFWRSTATWVGADISAAIDVARERLGHVGDTHFVQADALQLPFPDATFGAIFSEGVLHHTPSTRDALRSAARVVQTGGTLQFYVYRRKGPVREFTDDYIREQIAPLSDDEAWAAMRSLTELARALHTVAATINVDDVPLLGIRRGTYDIQRFVYWNFAKVYWNDSLSFEENVHVNFDWYRPQYAHRQTAAELRAWCDEFNLRVDWFHEQDSGFSVRAVKM